METGTTPRASTEELYSVEQVAERLGLHVRTVRNYIRDGKLTAVRIGKQYRIAREHLETLTGHPSAPIKIADEGSGRHLEVSSIVQIESIDFEPASRVTNALMAAANGRPGGHEPLRIDTIFDRERGRLKVILTGDLSHHRVVAQVHRCLSEVVGQNHDSHQRHARENASRQNRCWCDRLQERARRDARRPRSRGRPVARRRDAEGGEKGGPGGG